MNLKLLILFAGVLSALNSYGMKKRGEDLIKKYVPSVSKQAEIVGRPLEKEPASGEEWFEVGKKGKIKRVDFQKFEKNETSMEVAEKGSSVEEIEPAQEKTSSQIKDADVALENTFLINENTLSDEEWQPVGKPKKPKSKKIKDKTQVKKGNCFTQGGTSKCKKQAKVKEKLTEKETRLLKTDPIFDPGVLADEEKSSSSFSGSDQPLEVADIPEEDSWESEDNEKFKINGLRTFCATELPLEPNIRVVDNGEISQYFDNLYSIAQDYENIESEAELAENIDLEIPQNEEGENIKNVNLPWGDSDSVESLTSPFDGMNENLDREMEENIPAKQNQLSSDYTTKNYVNVYKEIWFDLGIVEKLAQEADIFNKACESEEEKVWKSRTYKTVKLKFENFEVYKNFLKYLHESNGLPIRAGLFEEFSEDLAAQEMQYMGIVGYKDKQFKDKQFFDKLIEQFFDELIETFYFIVSQNAIDLYAYYKPNLLKIKWRFQ